MATHFKGPILYSSARKGLENLNTGMWPDQCTLWDDFVVELDTAWTIIKDTGAAVAIAADTANGVLTITSTATTDNDGGSVQGNEVFQLPAEQGQMLWFEARYYVDSLNAGGGAGQMDTFIGLTENFVTNPENGLDRANRIGFQMIDGAATLQTVVGTTGPLLSAFSLPAANNVVDNAYQTVGFTLTKGAATNGTNVAKFFVNRQLVHTETTFITTDLITPAAVSISGDATGTKVMGVDYIMTSVDRVVY
tara:strand:+ start:2855 stop:3604 length:750 start_codon:yes stop_codon:yes gene_type:complete